MSKENKTMITKNSLRMSCFICFLLLSTIYSIAQESYDIVVYGGTSAGVTASVQAARMGKKVAMICTDKHIGGLTSSGLGATDINNREAIGGIAKEFYSRVYEHYSYSGAWIFTTSQNYFENENNRYFGNNKIKRVFGGKNDDMKIMWVFEPHVAQKNFRPIERPTNYNPLWFEHYARIFALNPCIDIFKVITITPLPNKKTDINQCDFVGANYGWPEGDYTVRARLAKMHKDYALGKVWFLQNDPRVPEHIRIKVREYGLPRDEFKDNDNFPYQLYVREARRMISEYVMTEHDVIGMRMAPTPIGLGTYSLDSHVVSHFVDEKNKVWIEGAFYQPSNIYPISYQSIRPKKEECSNLLIPVCLSATHTAYGSIRMEPVFMVLGQSAAAAASLAIDLNVSVQKVPYADLRKVLEKDNQILEWND